MKAKHPAAAASDAIGQQFWNSVSEGEKRNWPGEGLETVYSWFRENLASEGTVTEIDIHDDASYVSVLSIDCPFIIDSLTALVQRCGYSITGLVHPVITDASLKRPRSLVSMRLSESLSAAEAAALAGNIEQVMEDVILGTRDWRTMRGKMQEVLTELSGSPEALGTEEREFLHYLIDNNFTFLGYAKTAAAKRAWKDGLGILSDERDEHLIADGEIALPVTPHLASDTNQNIVVFKLPLISNVHRPVRLDAVVVRGHDKKGVVTEEHVFVGLFTSVTYSRSIKDVPLLRGKASAVIDQSGFDPDHHDHKAMSHILEKYPRDELFRIDLDTLSQFATGIMRLQERQRIALFARLDPLTHNISALVYVPRERYETRLRMQIQKILEREFDGVSEGHTVSLDDSPLVRLLFSLRTEDTKTLKADPAQVEKVLIEETRSWTDRLRSVLPREDVARYENAFPVGYQTKYGTSTILTDIGHLNRAMQENALQLELYRPAGIHANRMRFKIYSPGEAVPLSDVLPILENFGLRVISERPFEVVLEGREQSVYMQDFMVAAADAEAEYDIVQLRPIFEEAFLAIWNGAAENDALNRLIARAQMNVRQVMILRAYTRYLHQIRAPYSPAYVLSTLGDYPCLSQKLVRLFEAMFDPALDDAAREATIKELQQKIAADLGKVSSLDQDTIIRRVLNLIVSTLRTNAFQKGEDGQLKDYLSFKILCEKVTEMPDPRPKYEIFVSSARMEGVHLRMDDVARGGIRWSDRQDDFRTEILGLVKAQLVKNAVIVPSGAKGGFILKRPPLASNRQAFQEEGIACYKTLVRGLLDVTDNIVSGEIVHPVDVVRRDGDDSYLVVAADKGTATFSDIANGLSQQYGFWLDDAFASGGSVGYDHKAMGITARGAWECIKRHFRENGKNIQAEPFTTIGVGDMGGDVFGNGMILSEYTKLVGAFNHMHIFCDPNPDMAKSFAERKRLFEAVKGWGDYDAKLLSKGGRIFLRSEKTLQLTPEIKAVYGIEADEVSPAQLMKAMLQTPVELLYFGGIGTYIKDDSESHADASDKANDAIRVNATEVRASVIGEGANLGITQRARITMGRQGVRMNTDFVDNSAGVDCSDHEVNIKILLTRVMQDKDTDMDRPARDKLLAGMTNAVGALVLRDNYQQSQAITLVQMKGPELLPAHALTMDRLQASYGLNRKIEYLPGAKEVEERQRLGQGLTRPEIAVLVSYAKMALTREILNSDIPDQPYAAIWLETYFPDALRKTYAAAIARHPLRREIVATQIANSVINRMGPHFIFTKQEQTGLSVATIVDAYLVARDVLNLHPIWNAIESLDNEIDAGVQMGLLSKSMRVLDRLIGRLLHMFGERLRTHQAPQMMKQELAAMMPRLLTLISPSLREQYEQRMSQLKDQKVPKGVAEAVTMLPFAAMACDGLQLAGGDSPIDMSVAAFFAVGDRFQIDMIRHQARYLAAETPDNASAVHGLIDSLMTAQIGLTQQILSEKGADVPARLNAWLAGHAESMNALDRLLASLRDGHLLDLGRLVVIEQKIRQLSQRA